MAFRKNEEMVKNNDVINTYIEIIEIYDSIVNGNENKFGLLDCIDGYYSSCWKDDFTKLEKLKLKIKKHTK